MRIINPERNMVKFELFTQIIFWAKAYEINWMRFFISFFKMPRKNIMLAAISKVDIVGYASSIEFDCAS